MTTYPEELTLTFKVSDRQDQERILHVYTTYSSSPDPSGDLQRIPRMRSILTSDGTPVNRTRKGVYLIVGTNEILRSNDPDAP